MGLGVAGTAAAIAAAGSVASAGIGAATAGAQRGAVAGGSGAANAAQQQALEQARTDLEPWRTSGTNALLRTSNLAGANGPEAASAEMGNFYTSPGYQFRLDEGMRGVDASAAARGMLRSGATLKGEQAFAQGLASSEFDNYYNRLFNLSKLGEAAATGSADASLSTGRGVAATDIGAANAQSSIYGNLGQGLGSVVNGLASNKNVTDWLGTQFGGDPVSNSTVANNALYQQGAFAAQPVGTYGPFR